MTQIFTGTGLGTHGSSLGQLGSYGPKGTATLGQGGGSVYVNAANGNLQLKQADGFLSNLGVGLDLYQTYNSLDKENNSWRFNFESRLKFDGKMNVQGSKIIRIDEDGHLSDFIYQNQKQAYIAEDGSIAQITLQNGNWIYQEGSGQYFSQYNSEGLLTHLSDREGHQLSIHYENGQLATITDTSGQQKITWNFSHNLLSNVILSSEGQLTQSLHYNYDSNKRLIQISRRLDESTFYITRYSYLGETHLITDINQSDGISLHIDYDAQHRVKRLMDAEGRVSLFDYFAGKTVETNSLGESWVYSYDDQARLTAVDGPENYHIRYRYEGKHLATITQGALIWRFEYNESGDCIQLEAPNGGLIKRSFDSEHRIITETKYVSFDEEHHPAQAQTIRFTYDDKGHLRFLIKADGTVTEHRYDHNGLRISTRCYLQGRLNHQNLEETKTLSLEEFAKWIIQQNQQEISLIEYQYDSKGQLSQEIHFTHIDEQGLGVDTEDAIKTLSHYDAAGHLVQKSSVGDKGLNSTHYFYDTLGRLIKILDNQDHQITYEYDDEHHRVIKTEPNGLKTLSIFDKSGLLLSNHRIDNAQDYGLNSYRYDSASRLVSERDASGKMTYYFYDAQGRLHAKVSSTGQAIEYNYDDVGNCISIHQFQNKIDTLSFSEKLPDWKAIRPQNASQDRIKQSVYNQYNQLAYQIDSEGAVLGFEYDAEGRILSKIAFAKPLAHFSLNHPLSFDDVVLDVSIKDRRFSYFYDAEGRLQGEINAEGSAISYVYDALGHLVETCRHYNKPKSPFCRDWDLVKPETNQYNDERICSLYNSVGLKIADIDAEQYVTEYRYNARGLLIESIAYYQELNSEEEELRYSNSTRSESSYNDRHIYYRYNDLNQLIEERTSGGLVISYTYNEMGLVVSKQSTDVKTQEHRQLIYKYDNLGRVIQSLDAEGAALLNDNLSLSPKELEHIWQQHSINYTYDKAGRLLSKTNALNQKTTYFYNEEGLLTYTLSAAGAIVETRYNAFLQIETTIQYSARWTVSGSEISFEQLQQVTKALADARFDDVMHYEYNALGLVISKKQGSGSLFTYSYNAFEELDHSVQSTDFKKAFTTRYDYDKQGLLTSRCEDSDGINKSYQAEYNTLGRLVKSTNGNHHTTRWKWNKRGELTLMTYPGQESKYMSYDAFGRLLILQDEKETYYSYDDLNNSLRISTSCSEDDPAVVTEFNAFGDKITLIDANLNKTIFEYDAKGQLIHIKAPEGQKTDYQYDAVGNLIIEQNEKSKRIRFVYDAEQHLLSKTLDPEGLNQTTQFTYDGIGRQLSVVEYGRLTQFTYDNQGHLIKKCIDPQGLNLQTEYQYAESGELILETAINTQGVNKVIAYTWDALGRCTSTCLDPNGLALTTRFEYDANDNLIREIDAKNQVKQFLYNADNRLQYSINPRGVVTEHYFNNKGYEIRTTHYVHRVDASVHYSGEQLVQALKPDSNLDQNQFFLYDLQGRLRCSYDSLGYPTSYVYDENNNLITKKIYAQPCSLERLKQRGWPFPNENAEFRVNHYAYDGLNRQKFQLDTKGRLTEYIYNNSNELIEQIRYKQTIPKLFNYSIMSIQEQIQCSPNLDQHIRNAYDKAGRLSAQINPEGLITTYQYDAFGNLIKTTRHASLMSLAEMSSEHWFDSIKSSSNDRTLSSVYDSCNRELFRISATGKVLGREYDALGNVLTERVYAKTYQGIRSLKDIREFLNDSQEQLTEYEYDALGRLLSKTDALKQSTSYLYDANNNVTNKTLANKASWTYLYDESNQIIETITPKITVCRFIGEQLIEEQRSIRTQNEYDSFGNLVKKISDVDGLKQTIEYQYDVENRKIAVLYPDSKVNRAGNAASKERIEENVSLKEVYNYNPYGELIESIDKAGNSRHFIYDSCGRMLYALDAKNALIHYEYDTFDNVMKKTSYAKPLELSPGTSYNETTLSNASSKIISAEDRHEYCEYDQANRLLKTQKDAVFSFNPQTGSYYRLQPSTDYLYNIFGELVQTTIQVNELVSAKTTLYYNQEGLKTAQINAEGYVTTYEYDDFCRLASQTEWAERSLDRQIDTYSEPKSSSKDRKFCFIYDAIGQLTSKTAKNVSYSCFTGNGSHYETLKKDLTSTYKYDTLGNLVCTIDSQGQSAYSFYNELGQLTAKLGTLTTVGRGAKTYAYDALGNLVEVKQWAKGAGLLDEYHYALNGASTADTVTQERFDAFGHMIEQVDGKGHRINYSYDAQGNIARVWQLVTQRDQNQIVQDKRYSYDAENHLTSTAMIKNNGLYATEEAQYNAFGELTAKGVNGKYTQHIDYDVAGRIWRSNTQGFYQIYVCDLMDNVTQVVTSANIFHPQHGDLGVDLSELGQCRYDHEQLLYDLQRQDNHYDLLGRLTTQIKDGSNKAIDREHQTSLKRSTQKNELDRWGNICSNQNANGYITLYEYNDFDEVIKQTLPEIRVVDEHGVARWLRPELLYAYDALGRAIAMTDANGHRIAKRWDSEGHLISEIDAKGAHRDKSYNLLGQLESSRNELGYLTRYTYDHANRLISVQSANKSSFYEYDELGQLTQQKEGWGRAENKTTFAYDLMGNQVFRQHAEHRSYSEFDDQHRKIRELDANGKEQTWIYNDAGNLVEHTDLGGHKTSYTYNHNGLILTEQSTSGKDKVYHYYSDGLLEEYYDKARNEIALFSYDAQGNVVTKGSSMRDVWMLETDYFVYDSLGRLVQVKRYNPNDIDVNNPDVDKNLLSIDYEYDAIGNIRDTKVMTNYPKHKRITQEDYYTYDENNRILINKGVLQNNNIVMTASQGSELHYDAAGNILSASKFEAGWLNQFSYRYTQDNQVELIRKNKIDFQTKVYDSAGNVIEEHLYNEGGYVTQHNRMDYKNGLLEHVITSDRNNMEMSKTEYLYDGMDNLINQRTQFDWGRQVQTHTYSYALWDNYQQEIETVKFEFNGVPSWGQSTRTYDVNGLLKKSTDLNGQNTVEFISSGLDGIKVRKDSLGKVQYLHLAGKTIGDLWCDNNHGARLEVYGGFTPKGTQEQSQFGPSIKESWQTTSTTQGTPELPNTPQNNLGAYTLQAGDTLESIALQVYGDASLWYLIADANGITERNLRAGEKGGQLHVGLRLNIPPAANSHHSNATHNVLNRAEIIGNTSATAPRPLIPPTFSKRHKSPWRILGLAAVAVVATVATVMSAGAIGLLTIPGATYTGLSGLVNLGLSVLGGASSLGTAGTAVAGFGAGFIGNIAGQGAAMAFNLQKDMDFKSAFITGIASAATAGVSSFLKGNTQYGNLIKNLDKHSSEFFKISSATDMMERDLVGQAINLGARRQDHLDWLELSISTATAGFMASPTGTKLTTKLDQTFKKSAPTLSSELQSLTTGAITSAATGTHFDAMQILSDNLGNAVANNILEVTGEETNNLNSDLNDSDISNTKSTKKLEELVQIEIDQVSKHSKEVWKNENSYENLKFSSDFFYDWKSDMSETIDRTKITKSTIKIKKSNFEIIQQRIFTHEGSISNHLNDEGGFTNKGITLATFQEFAAADLRVAPSIANLKKITNEQANNIYKKRFWEPIYGDQINSFSLAYALYDFHINAPGHAVELLQKSANKFGGNLLIDNKMGPKTIKFINSIEPKKLFDIYQKARVNYYVERVNKRPDQHVFLKGWLNRVNDIKFER